MYVERTSKIYLFVNSLAESLSQIFAILLHHAATLIEELIDKPKLYLLEIFLRPFHYIFHIEIDLLYLRNEPLMQIHLWFTLEFSGELLMDDYDFATLLANVIAEEI